MASDRITRLAMLHLVASQPLTWGKAGAGMLIVCREDQTVLLTLRAPSVLDPYTWGIPGGAVGDDGYHTPDGPAVDLSQLSRPAAERECREELGSLPNIAEEWGTTEFRNGSFVYTTYVVGITAAEKAHWTPAIQLNWENTEARWFPLADLPGNLHHGVAFTLSRHPMLRSTVDARH